MPPAPPPPIETIQSIFGDSGTNLGYIFAEKRVQGCLGFWALGHLQVGGGVQQIIRARNRPQLVRFPFKMPDMSQCQFSIDI